MIAAPRFIRRRLFLTATLASLLLVLPSARADGCPPGTSHTDEGTCEAFASNDSEIDYVSTPSGLRYLVVDGGSSEAQAARSPQSGQRVSAHYTGWTGGFDRGAPFDSSRRKGSPFSFVVGRGKVIQGWEEAISSMVKGERRRLIIPPELGYGDAGAGGVIPPGATLYFDVELVDIWDE